MPIHISVKIEGDQQVLRSFTRFAEDVQDLTQPFNEIANDFLEIERKQFDSEGGYGSGGWANLSNTKTSPSTGKKIVGYADWKAAHFPGASILVRWGNLRDSLTQFGDTYHIREVEPMKMVLGTDLPYAKYHQTGTSKMPKRRPIDLTEDDKTRWVKIIQRFLVERAKLAGFTNASGYALYKGGM
ncbi:hypothetical protein M0R72_13135 [Candidatus Pacearchaeota archaeon]|jgi:phage gpG-like protein|nr:hypothetical protein [Candidatus Pacearchaeota archaeon]